MTNTPPPPRRSTFDIIKKQNGERFAKTIRTYDNGIFDVPNLPDIVKYAGRDAEPLMNYLVSLKDIQIEEHGVYQHPIELLRLAGYDAYYADTLEKQNAISKYYEYGEKLCTFNDPYRFEKYHIINAVKHNVNDIKRENFTHPEREDEYGTSVLSIQILKTGGFISIKNRYNHTVENPDNTLNSNPDNIIKGLSESIKHYYKVDFSSQIVQLPRSYTIMDNKIINFDYEINNTYFGKNYYAKDGVVHELDKNNEIMLDYFVLNLKTKTIKNPSNTEDCFPEVLQKEIEGKKLQIIVNEDGHKCLLADGVQILEMDKGEIVSLYLPTTKEIGNSFLENNNSLKSFCAPNLNKVGNDFLSCNEVLTSLTLPNLNTVGDEFLRFNNVLTSLTLPNLNTVGDDFLRFNNVLTSLTLPNLNTVGNNFLRFNEVLTSLTLPNLNTVGNNFLRFNEVLTSLTLPNLNTVGDGFLFSNKVLTSLAIPAKTINEYKDYILQNHPKRNKLFDNILNQKSSLTDKLRQLFQSNNKESGLPKTPIRPIANNGRD